MSDWRLQGQERYLKNKTLTKNLMHLGIMTTVNFSIKSFQRPLMIASEKDG